MQYSKLVEIYSKLEETGSSLKKTEILADFIFGLEKEDLKKIILLIQGKVFPDWDKRELGIGVKLALKALSSSTGTSIKDIEKEWSKIGDVGEIAEKIIKNRKQKTLFSKTNSLLEVYSKLEKLASTEGQGAVDRKMRILKELISNSKPNEAKYILRTCLSDLRVGVGAGVLRDAISKAFDVEKKNVQHAYDLLSDFSEVAVIAKEKSNSGLEKVRLQLGKPIRVMLFQKVSGIPEAFERVGKPAAIEYKYDGFRLQIHKNKDKVQLFTRRQEDVTNQFPDIVERVKKTVNAEKCIIDSEVIGLDKKTGNWLPFQNISQRIKRKYKIKEMVKKIPVIIAPFDLISLEGNDLLETEFSKRRKKLKKIIKSKKNKIEIAKQIITSNEKQAKKFYKESLEKGNEGVMVKNLEAKYKPGSRVGYGVKVKPETETLEVVIIGAEWGTGKRAGWLTSYTLACVEPEKEEFLTIGKMSTGVKEKSEEGISYADFTKLLKPLIIKKSGKSVKVKPQVIVEVGYEEIQKSPSYKSGYALRFPRLIKLREDRKPEEIDTLDTVKNLYKKQRYRT